MQVIGLCRFSYPAEGGFQVGHDTFADRCAYLYDPVRLEERFRFFEGFTLPALRVQSDPDFTFLVVIGETLPPDDRARLVDLLKDIPQAVLLPLPAGPHRKTMQDAINTVRRKSDEPCLQFRLDDDDAISRYYVERLREAAQSIRPLIDKNRHVAIDFNQGFLARPGPDGIMAKPNKTPYETAALAITIRPKLYLSVMNFAHTKVAHHMPTVTLTGEDMYVRGHNDFNDSRQGAKIKPVALTPLDQSAERHFKNTFNIDADHIRRLFA
ncbi:MAG: putative rhamnosyl transferase [Rhodobacterales bacterium]|nr:putative rhamnosyl transferase [Rhodobacterales bacterium]